MKKVFTRTIPRKYARLFLVLSIVMLYVYTLAGSFFVGKLYTENQQLRTIVNELNEEKNNKWNTSDRQDKLPGGTMCTMDALMCPDGTWVGRSGPNCEFVCDGEPVDSGQASPEEGFSSPSSPTSPEIQFPSRN